jgi:transposase InsO family protein
VLPTAEEVTVTPESLEEYAKVMRMRYQAAQDRTQQGALLDEYCAVTGQHRKSAIRRLNATAVVTPQPRPGRRQAYGVEVIDALERLWGASAHLCSKRLAAALPDLLAALETHGEVALAPEVRAALLRMSPATIDRRLAARRPGPNRQPFTQSASAAAVRARVPVRTFGEWDSPEVGECQADLVAHCGDTTAGHYLTTLTLVDVATLWTELDVVNGKDYLHVRGALHFARRRLPFALRHVHSDNGGEFLNHPLQEYCQREGIATSRGRPYRKNDQSYVEQRNGSVVRRWAGYDRYDGKPALELLKRLYAALRPFLNHFQPVQRLVEKQREGAKVHKRYDEPQTPYARLLARGTLTPEQADALRTEHATLNPAALLRTIAACQDALVRHIDHSQERRFGNTLSEANPSDG